MTYRQHIHHLLLRLFDTFRERRRWHRLTPKDRPRVYYGQPSIPCKTELLGGGLVKLQEMAERFPNNTDHPNLCYLVSSALPPNPDLIIAHAHKAGARVVLNQNGVAYHGWHGPGWEKTNRRLASVYHAADFIVFQSGFCKLGASQFLGPTETPNTTLYNPVDTDFFHPSQHKTPRHACVLLLAGTHHFFYRVQTAIETLAHLIRDGVPCTLRITGQCRWQKTESQCLDEINALSRTLQVEDQVEYLGAYTQQEAVNMFQHADILLHCQYNDPCPRLVVEAMACGVPVVYSASGGVPELVAPTAGIGIPAPLDWQATHPPSPERMASAVREILSRYDSFSQEARAHAIRHFAVQDWLDAHERIFSDLLSQSGRSM